MSYVSPNCDVETFNVYLKELEQALRTTDRHIIMAGDFNAECFELYGVRSMSRGYRLATLLGSCGLVTLNTPGVHTFSGCGSGSVLDVIAVTDTLLRGGFTWEVLDHEFLSDHSAILFAICLEGRWMIPLNKI